MDKILSARVDEAVLRKLGLLAARLKTTKKAIIEEAILAFEEKAAIESEVDALKQTLGAWKRDESPVQTVEMSRKAFRKSMERHHR
jgi:predicted transcriptional regulator